MLPPCLKSIALCGFGVALLLAGGAVNAQGAPAALATPPIDYVSPDQSVWTTRTDAQGQPENPLLRVAAQLFAKAGIAWRNQSYPAARMFKYLQDGSAQFSMLVRAPMLQDCCLWSRKPITAVEIRVYHLAHKPAIKTSDDLVGKSVITVHGYSYGGLLRTINDEGSRIRNETALTHASAFKMLARGRADYVIDYAGPAGEVLAADPLATVRSELLSRRDVYLVLSRTYPDAPKVMARLESIAEGLDVEMLMKDSDKAAKP